MYSIGSVAISQCTHHRNLKRPTSISMVPTIPTLLQCQNLAVILSWPTMGARTTNVFYLLFFWFFWGPINLDLQYKGLSNDEALLIKIFLFSLFRVRNVWGLIKVEGILYIYFTIGLDGLPLETSREELERKKYVLGEI